MAMRGSEEIFFFIHLYLSVSLEMMCLIICEQRLLLMGISCGISDFSSTETSATLLLASNVDQKGFSYQNFPSPD